jgi:hypothetical protein
MRYGLLAGGLLLAGVGFLVYLGNALALEGASGTLTWAAVLAMIGGSVTAGAGALLGAGRARLYSRATVVLAGGLGGAVAGRLLGSLLFAGGRWHLEWMIALCFTPLGMWLGLLAERREAEYQQGSG